MRTILVFIDSKRLLNTGSPRIFASLGKKIRELKKGELILYQPEDQSTQIEVRVVDDTIWLTIKQIAGVFGCSGDNVSLHLNNIYMEGELSEESTSEESSEVQLEGSRWVRRKVVFYNLDAVISVGYRVNSKRGTQFRIWANGILKNYLLKGHAISQRIANIENRLTDHDQKFDLLIRSNLLPAEGIFYDGQIFDSYKFAADIIRSAVRSIILIDNYVDEGVLTLLSKRSTNVKATIYTSQISNQLKLDVQRFNSQYPPIDLISFSKSHDRFLIIDQVIVYHLGASLKDLGKKWFAFSKMVLDPKELISKLI